MQIILLNHIYSAFVSAAFEFAAKPDVGNHQCEVTADYSCTEGEDVCIVMLTGEQGRVRLTAHYCTYAFYLVCTNRNTDTSAADENTFFAFAACHSFGNSFTE